MDDFGAVQLSTFNISTPRFLIADDVNWSIVSTKERAFIEEVARVNYERNCSFRLGKLLSSIRPAFAS